MTSWTRWSGSRAPLFVALALVASPGFARAQPRERPAEPTAAIPIVPRCGARMHPLASTPIALPDAAAPPSLVGTDGGALLAWRAQSGSLELTVIGAGLERAADDREIAQPVGVFAATAAPGGAAVVMVERERHGDDALLLARVASNGEARNVPRVLAWANRIDGVAIVWSGGGYVVAWSLAGESAGTFALATDARGVPVGAAHRVLDARAPRLARLSESGDVVLTATGPGGEPTAVVLDREANPSEGVTWPGTARRIATGSAESGILSIALPTGADGTIAPVAVHWSPGTPPLQSEMPIRFAPGTTAVDLVPDHGAMIAAFDEPAGREVVARVAPDGAATVLATRTGSLGALHVAADGSFWLAGHETAPPGRTHLALLQILCPRSITSSPSASAPAEATAGDVAPRR